MSDAQFEKRVYGPLNDRALLSSAYEKLEDALNSADFPEILEGSVSAAAYSLAELHWRLFDKHIRAEKSNPGYDSSVIEWEQTVRDEFASQWPCCDVPATGWVTLDVQGDVVDMSAACFRCEHGGGFDEFIEDLKSGKALPRDC
tara:strand:- start:6 stop:437 length:432 start_codon:yes stop_codon:yes gene_type:complete